VNSPNPSVRSSRTFATDDGLGVSLEVWVGLESPVAVGETAGVEDSDGRGEVPSVGSAARPQLAAAIMTTAKSTRHVVATIRATSQ
jgi:hypothetical protein